MSRSTLRPVVKLRSTAGTGYTYVTRKSRRNDPDRSTATSERTITWEDGRTYPVVDVEISSASHPFYTGQARVLDTAGRVEQFRRRYGDKATGA
jgi:large subunit ribosomal protein L31